MNNKELKENLFGREAVLNLLKRRVADLKDGYRQNIALLGNEFIGKSTILLEFIKNLNDEKVLPIFIEIENINFRLFVTKYIGTLLFNFLKIKSMTAEENLEIMQESAKRFIPSTVEQIKKIRASLEKGKNIEAYRELVALPQRIFEESGIFCLVVLDEFQKMEEFGQEFIFQELGKKIMLQRNSLYIVSSSQKSLAKRILSEKLSLLFGQFDLVDIFAFDVRVSQNFINQKLGNILSKDYKNFLIDFTAGYPLYLDIICEELARIPLAWLDKNISLEKILEILIKLLYEKTGFFHQHFSLLLEKIERANSFKGLTEVLIALANGKNKLREISTHMAKEKGSATQKIARLLEMNIISKNGNFYYICDRLFGFWLREVFQKKKNTFNCDTDFERARFKETLKNAIDNFCQISQKDLSARVIELLNLFDNEYFQFNGHRYRLPEFNEIRQIRIEKQNNFSFEALVAKSPEAYWLVLLKEGGVSEEEMGFFFENVAKLEIKPEKKILIFVNDIEPNARLKALQEKMWLWNSSDLNLLMNFYHRPYFIK